MTCMDLLGGVEGASGDAPPVPSCVVVVISGDEDIEATGDGISPVFFSTSGVIISSTLGKCLVLFKRYVGSADIGSTTASTLTLGEPFDLLLNSRLSESKN